MSNTITLKKDHVLSRKDEPSNDLYYVTAGKLMICSRSGRMVTPIAYLEKGEYFGELSFFDNLLRSADVITVEPTTLVKIPKAELKEQFPTWLLIVAKQMTKKLRMMNQVISERGIKKRNVKSMRPLDIEQQRYYYDLLENS
jgi:CRP/FNR family cyclic AMP-dependent transcriptional regulator